MTSECYVYMTLPGQISAITVGKFQLGNIGRFVYGKKYLSRPDAVEIDPVELKLAEQLYETAQLGGMFGALRDAGPDYWGRRIIERHAGKQDLNELDYLL